MLEASPKRAGIPLRAQRLDLGALLADHDVGEPAPVERAGDEPADLAVATQDRVQAQGRVGRAGRQEGEIARPPGHEAGHQRVDAETRLERVHEVEEDRVERDRAAPRRR